MTNIVPESFPHKGKFRRYDKQWNLLPPEQWTDEPQYPGQQPVRFPLDWTPLECFLAVGEGAKT